MHQPCPLPLLSNRPLSHSLQVQRCPALKVGGESCWGIKVRLLPRRHNNDTFWCHCARGTCLANGMNEAVEKTFLFLIWGLPCSVPEKCCLPLRGTCFYVCLHCHSHLLDSWEDERAHAPSVHTSGEQSASSVTVSVDIGWLRPLL
jgi:hypothetical protein